MKIGLIKTLSWIHEYLGSPNLENKTTVPVEKLFKMDGYIRYALNKQSTIQIPGRLKGR